MAKGQTAAAVAPVVDEAAEFRRLIFDAPIAELAQHQGISIDEAVKLRVEQAVAAATEPQVTVRPDRATQERLDSAAYGAYNAAVEKLVARAEAVRPAPIKEQMAKAAQEASKENAARPTPEKGKEARDAR